MNHFEFEKYYFKQIKFMVNSFQMLHQIKVMKPCIFWIKDICHAVIKFPDNSIFNCNQREYPLFNTKLQLFGIENEQVEPSFEEYREYWSTCKYPFITYHKNCILWCFYYLEWFNCKSIEKKFPNSVRDLEMWSILQFTFC